MSLLCPKPSNGPHLFKVQCSTYHGPQSPIGLAPSPSGCLDVPQTHQASLRPFALAVPSSQWCAGKYLTNGSEGENPQYLLISVYKCSPQADFNLSIWLPWTHSWEEICTTGGRTITAFSRNSHTPPHFLQVSPQLSSWIHSLTTLSKIAHIPTFVHLPCHSWRSLLVLHSFYRTYHNLAYSYLIIDLFLLECKLHEQVLLLFNAVSPVPSIQEVLNKYLLSNGRG